MKRIWVLIITLLICTGLLWTQPSNGLSKESILGGHVIDDMLFGDIDKDGIVEQVTFSHLRTINTEDGFNYTVSVFKEYKSSITFVWTDKEKLGFWDNGMQSPPVLVGIGDILNNGVNYVIIEEIQSDVRPSIFNLLIWEKEGLKRDRDIVFLNNKILNPNDDSYWKITGENKRNYVWSEFKILNTSDGTKILAPIFYNDEKTQENSISSLDSPMSAYPKNNEKKQGIHGYFKALIKVKGQSYEIEKLTKD
ncbi:MAG: hypothetical protein PHE88_08240 [Elusimicrobia bacterium]|nr:hypothetical protein [Elusimicrobiota bacterium]